MKLDEKIDYTSLEIAGIDMRDYPDFCDAYIESGCTTDGRSLTDEELDVLSEDYELVYELVINHIN